MRTLRGALAGAIAIAALAVFPAPAAHAAAPSAPYTAFTLDGGESTVLLKGTLSFDLGNTTTFYFGPNGDSPTPDNILVMAINQEHLWTATLVPPAGTTWTAGTTYETRRFPDNNSQATLDVSGDHVGCNAENGTLTVKEIAREAGTGKVTAFAASFNASCEPVQNAINGEIRWNSSIGYVAAVGDKSLLDFGQAYFESTTAPQTVTFTSTGSQPIEFGTAGFAGAVPGAYSVGTDTCSNATLAYGETCAVQVMAHPTGLGTQASNLVLPDNTNAAKKIVRLTVDGKDPRTVALAPASLDFGPADPDVDGAPLTVTVTANGTKPVTLGTPTIGGATPAAFKITGSTCTAVTLAVGQQCEIAVTPHATTTGYQNASLLIPDNSLTNPKVVPLLLNGGMTPRGTYYPLAPQRILDTRSGNGAPKAPIGADKVIHLQVTGRGGVPFSGVSAVVLNMTVTTPTAAGYLTVFPTGVTRPTASSLNFPKVWTGANSVTVAVGDGGKVDVYNSNGSTQVIADVTGYFASDNTTQNHGYDMGGAYHPITPTRLLDTRKGSQKLPGGYYVNAAASWGSPVNSHIKAFAVNITAVSPNKSGYLTAWNGSDYTFPSTSTLNYAAGKIVPNMAIVPTMPCYQCGSAEGWPSIGVYTSATTHVLVDLVGFFDDSTLTGGLRFTPITPTRITDSRIPLGVAGPLGPSATATITAPGAIATPETEALALNVTAVAPTVGTYLTVWPSGIAKPTVSSLNPAAGQTVPNAVIAGLSTDGAFNVYNNAGTTGLVVDVVGTYWLYPGTAGLSSVSGFSASGSAVGAGLPAPTVFEAAAPRPLG